jgi:hypothetical protein
MAIFEVVLIGVIFGGGGLLLLVTAIGHMRRRREIGRWPRVDGEVVGHQVQGSHRNFRPRFEVRYQFTGRSRVHVVDSPTGLGHQRSGPARRALTRHPVGSTVRLYVHPEHGEPAYGVLPEMLVIVALTIGGLLFVGVAAVAVVTAL